MPLIEGSGPQLCNEHSWHILYLKGKHSNTVILLVLLWQVYRLDSRFALTSLALMTGLDFDLILLTWDSYWQVLKQPVLARLDLKKLATWLETFFDMIKKLTWELLSWDLRFDLGWDLRCASTGLETQDLTLTCLDEIGDLIWCDLKFSLTRLVTFFALVPTLLRKAFDFP